MTVPAPAHPRRLAFLGTPAMAVPPLRTLLEAGFEVVLVVSGPDRRRGRGTATSASPVKAAAVDLGLAVTDRVDDVLDADVDLGVVVAFGRIIKPHVLDRLAMVNLHFSLLPRWRGAAPVERALLAGDKVTGVCVMAVENGLDTGGVYARAELPIASDVTADELRAELVAVGTGLLVDTLRAGLGKPEPQAGEATYADKIRTDELEIDWRRPIAEIRGLVRLGGAWTPFRGTRLKVWSVAPADVAEPDRAPVVEAGDGALVLRQVQPEGKRRMAARDWANGARPTPADWTRE